MPEGHWLILLYRDKRIRANCQCLECRKKEIGIASAWARQLEDICSISPHLKTSGGGGGNLQTKLALQDRGYFRLDLYALSLLKVSQDVGKEKDSKKKS